MTHEPQVPKPTSADGSTGKGKRWNPLRLDKPLLPRTAAIPQSALSQPFPTNPEADGDNTTPDLQADPTQGTTQRIAKLPIPPKLTHAVRVAPQIFMKQVGGIPWPNWKVLALIGFFGSGFFAAAALLRSPSLPNCPSIFWPMAPASLRLYCAELAANKQTAPDILEAMTLVSSLPKDHPLQGEVKNYLERWSEDLLEAAEDLFNQGRLLDAIQAVVQIPIDTEASKSAQKRIKRWQTIWSDALKTYQEAEAELREGNWRAAFRVGSELTYVGNTYWETTQFEAINRAVQQTRQEITLFYEAQDLIEVGGVTKLLEATRKLELIPANSYLIAKVMEEKLKVGNELLALAQASLDRQDLQEALDIVAQVPNVGDLPRRARDLGTLANAQAKAWNESSADLQAAITLAQSIAKDSPLYAKSQEWINRWQSVLSAVPSYNQAQQLASLGQVESLRAAIAQVNNIPRDNPIWKKVARSVQDWQDQIAQLEDRPVLDEAVRSAQTGDVGSLQAAIDRASQVESGRPLYAEARDRIQTWTTQIQQIEDQPILEQARSLASRGDLANAIAVVQQIRSGRSLYRDAQNLRSEWQTELDGQRNLGLAQQAASSGTVDGIVSGIRAANRVPRNSSSYAQSLQLVDEFSNALLQAASQAASTDLRQAIELAKKIPQNANNYGIAQEQIRSWRATLYPPAPAPLPEAIPVQPEPVQPFDQPQAQPQAQPQTQPIVQPLGEAPFPQPLNNTTGTNP